MSHVADSPKSRHFEPISGRFTPSGPQISAKSGSGGPLFGTRETWMVPTVPLATVLLTPHASRPTLHAPRSTPDQRGEVVRRTSPADGCMTPTADCQRPNRARSRRGGRLF